MISCEVPWQQPSFGPLTESAGRLLGALERSTLVRVKQSGFPGSKLASVKGCSSRMLRRGRVEQTWRFMGVCKRPSGQARVPTRSHMRI